MKQVHKISNRLDLDLVGNRKGGENAYGEGEVENELEGKLA